MGSGKASKPRGAPNFKGSPATWAPLDTRVSSRFPLIHVTELNNKYTNFAAS